MLGNRKTFKAQSAMEYLMTYGWAILIIAVVLGALFSLGVFSGSSLLGTSCVASPGYLCANPSLLTNGQLSFQFGQNTGTTIYNVELACEATTSTSGLPANSQSWNVLNTAGAPSGYPGNGLVSSSAPYLLLNGNSLTMSSGQTVNIGPPTVTTNGLPCYGATALPLVSAVNPSVAIGQPFSGFIWLNYTTSPCANSGGSPSCTWYTVKAATVTVKVV